MVETDTERGSERGREGESERDLLRAVNRRPVKAKSNCRYLCDLQLDLAFFYLSKVTKRQCTPHMCSNTHVWGAFFMSKVTFDLSDRTRPEPMCSLTLA